MNAVIRFIIRFVSGVTVILGSVVALYAIAGSLYAYRQMLQDTGTGLELGNLGLQAMHWQTFISDATLLAVALALVLLAGIAWQVWEPSSK
jgi:hypothetical protein